MAKQKPDVEMKPESKEKKTMKKVKKVMKPKPKSNC